MYLSCGKGLTSASSFSAESAERFGFEVEVGLSIGFLEAAGTLGEVGGWGWECGGKRQ